ncbi:hypothetical protein ES703_35818 [subsurface metagenome]
MNINRGVIESGGGHLAGDHPFPDKLVELELGVAQVRFKHVGLAVDFGGADGFVCLLRPLDCPGEGASVGGKVFGAVLLGDELPGLDNCRAGYPCRIGAHVGDKAHRAFFADGQAFVKLLGDAHGQLGGETELAPGFLLQGAGDEGWGGVAGGFFGACLAHLVAGFFQLLA